MRQIVASYPNAEDQQRRPLDAVVAFRGSRMLSDGPSNPSPIAGDVEMGIAFERAGMPDSAITAYEHYMNTPWAWHVREDAFRLPWALEHVAALYDPRSAERSPPPGG